MQLTFMLCSCTGSSEPLLFFYILCVEVMIIVMQIDCLNKLVMLLIIASTIIVCLCLTLFDFSSIFLPFSELSLM